MAKFQTETNMYGSDQEEEDYMSDAFLTKAIDEDVRLGLLKKQQTLRQNEIDAKKARIDEEHRQKQKPIKHLESERRQEGMSMALSSDNKGFAMLAKMGYKQGDAIGRASASGIVEPIAIQIKNDRGGLGREAAMQQLQEYREKLRKQHAERRNAQRSEMTTEQFRQRMAQKAIGRQMEADLGKCQRACEKLDSDESIQAPPMQWFWPERKINSKEQQDDPYDDQDESDPKAESKDSDDESSSDSEEESKQEEKLDDSTAKIVELIEEENKPSEKFTSELTDEDDDEIDYEISEKLTMLTDYLRTSYSFCHWCGVHYKDADDMKGNCPGPTKDEH